MTEAKLKALLKTNSDEVTAELKAYIDRELRALQKDFIAQLNDKTVSMEGCVQREGTRVLSSVSSGLHHVVKEVVSQLET